MGGKRQDFVAARVEIIYAHPLDRKQFFSGWPQVNYVAGITCLLPHSSAAHPRAIRAEVGDFPR